MGLNKRKTAKAYELYPEDSELRETFIRGFDYQEEAIELENRKYIWLTICTGVVIIAMAIYMYTLEPKSTPLFASSLITISLILVNAVSISKWLGNGWSLIISFGFGFLLFFLGRGEVSFETLKDIWLAIMKDKSGVSSVYIQSIEENSLWSLLKK
ncbi:hypothetical protein [Flavobacterium sp. TBRC 19031]|uniref:hypothetical protein n=1 Tax=Flavobacterium mekongense TaxID=3379707 RepID=UPI00399A8D8F